MAGRRCCTTERRRTRPPSRARWWSTFTPPASTRPITKGDWEALAPNFGSRIFWVATSRGVVSEVGPGVTDLAVGDAVFGVCDQGIEGAYAEKIAIKAAIVAKKPDRLGHAEAAAMALTGLTALWAL